MEDIAREKATIRKGACTIGVGPMTTEVEGGVSTREEANLEGGKVDGVGIKIAGRKQAVRFREREVGSMKVEEAGEGEGFRE